jgi:phosphoenolpyruvate carboxylase
LRRYASWPFFKGLVDLVEIEIAKADPSVSALYDAQCCAGDAQLTALGQELRLKLAEAVEVFLAISGKPELLAEQPRARAAALARRPYLNGLHAIQGEAMGRLRKAGAKLAEGSDEFRKLQDAMIVSVQGVAAGMQNTG